MKFLLTGNEGFIGKSFHQYLKSAYEEKDIFTADKTQGIDLTNKNLVKDLPDVDYVIHLAAFNGTKHFYKSPMSVIENSTIPTLNLLDRYAGNVKLFFYASTCEIYADACELGISPVPTKENTPILFKDPSNVRWSYGASKFLGEIAVQAAKKELDQDFIIFRYHNIYGPNQVDHFISEFTERALKGDLSLYGWENTRSFCYVDDAVRASHSVLLEKKAYNQILHFGNDDEISIKEVALKILDILDIRGELILKNAPEGSVSRRCPDIKLIRELIDYRPEVSIDEGLRLTLKKYL